MATGNIQLMISDLPGKKRDYIGPVTDTRIWNEFRFRPDDIVISTPPKCGTTWMQSIVMMLLHGTPRLEQNVWQLSPWLDCAFRDQAATLAGLNDQTGRRSIKTHTPLDGIAYSPAATFLAVYRHPVDVHFSLHRHAENLKEDTHGFMYPGDIHANFSRFLTSPATDMGTDDTTLASIVDHYLSFRRWAHLPNIHFFHYAEMKRDLEGQVVRLDDLLGTGHSKQLMQQIADAGAFEAMKETAARLHANAEDSPFKNDLDFFATARSGKWEGRLSTDEMSGFEDRIAALLPEDDANWLMWGERA